MNFNEFEFLPEVMESIDAIGFDKATPIQEKAIPVIMEGRDMIASAQTGTGKTAAFLLPLINKVMQSGKEGKIKALVVVPTRELAIQIDQQLEGFSYFTSVTSIPVYGGRDGESFTSEKKSLISGADIVVCTPGKIIAHLNMGYLSLDELDFLVLDEADRMLDMGFLFDIHKIISYLPKKRQNLLFSATMPQKIKDLAKSILIDPAEINIAISKPAEKILQLAYVVYERQKLKILKSILNNKDLKSGVIFCSTKTSAKELYRELKRTDLIVESIHSDLEQDVRTDVLNKFKAKRINILVATDIIARGIDVVDIELVVNYDVPSDAEDYVHRIGRTARAESDGVAITFISETEQKKFQRIETLLGNDVYKAPVASEFGDTPEYKKLKNKKNSRRNFKNSSKNSVKGGSKATKKYNRKAPHKKKIKNNNPT